MLAALPMYVLPELRSTLMEWWAAIRKELILSGITTAPESIDLQITAEELWARSDVLLMQTCGYPLVTGLTGATRLLGTPCYAADGCEGHEYRSVIVVRDSSSLQNLSGLRGTVCAFNDEHSQSGYNALRALLAPLAARSKPFFASVLRTGSHHASLAAVKSGDADVCAVDCVTFGLLHLYRPEWLHGLRILARTASAPGLPYVTKTAVADDRAHDSILEAVRLAFTRPCYEAIRAKLLITGFEATRLDDYDVVRSMQNEAIEAGYPELV